MPSPELLEVVIVLVGLAAFYGVCGLCIGLYDGFGWKESLVGGAVMFIFIICLALAVLVFVITAIRTSTL